MPTTKVSNPTKTTSFEHYFFATTAILFLLVCLAGFSAGINLKTSRGINMAASRYILHGLFGFIWMLLYVLQTQLVFRKKTHWHAKFGKAGFVVLILLALSTVYLIISARLSHPDIPIEGLSFLVGIFGFSLLTGMPLLFIGIAMRKQAFYHKRLMFYGTLLLADTGFDRLPLIFGIEETPIILIANLIFALPLLIYDLRTSLKKQKVFSTSLYLYPHVILILNLFVLAPYVYASKTWMKFVEWIVLPA
ncbi:hypothetical protein [Mangrovimonas sp. TPBH4]|uniref:hypothetical protein n=1 Tax=Mangrovimonas sp. TPBH4 TaxID=1645914 RepID=UPI0006B52025|nr:hypothetical protein [Mangrovimonas sp. TPBH4]